MSAAREFRHIGVMDILVQVGISKPLTTTDVNVSPFYTLIY